MTVSGMKIERNITEVNRTVKTSRDIRYIVVHYTGNDNDTAYNNTRYFKSVNRGASAHYFVDENEIWQCVDDKDVAWHCGANMYYHSKCRNANSIGVEMCSSVRKNDKVEQNTAELVKYLMKQYNIGSERVLRHYDVTHKQCPLTMLDNTAWADFKEKLLTEGEDLTMDKFSDIKGHYAEEHIKKLAECGIVNGYDDGTFRPDELVTRGQVAIMVANVLRYLGK